MYQDTNIPRVAAPKSISVHVAAIEIVMWPELPPDVVREISSHLHAAADLVRFHAVCKAWRDAATATMTRKPLLPLLLAQERVYPIDLRLRCVFSRTSYSVSPPFSFRRRNWVASEDGTSVWYLAQRPSPSLRDPLTGAVTLLLPPFPHEHGRWEDSPHGMVYSDGTVLLYTLTCHGNTVKFRAALLRPGSDATWIVEKRTFASSSYVGEFIVVYHRGRIVITVDSPVDTLNNVEAGQQGAVLTLRRPLMPGEVDYEFYVLYFFLQSRGELLCVSVHDHELGGKKASVPGLVRALSMSVHALEEDAAAAAAAGGKIMRRWVSKDSKSLADRVLFLGWPNSFAVDASQMSGDAVRGGFVYFVYRDPDAMPNQPCYVFRYDLIHHKAKFVEQLPQGQGWDNNMCTWLLFPHPSMAPTEEITGRLEGRKWWKIKKKKMHMTSTPRSNIYIERPQPQCYKPYFRVFVRNLPCKVDSFQLQQFFKKHGKVATAKVMCKRKNKKIGLVTIAMVEELEDALAALDGLVFNECILKVRLVRRWKGQHSISMRLNQHSRDYLKYSIRLLLLLFVVIAGILFKFGKLHS